MNLNQNSIELLDQLRDVHAPAFPSFWPPAPGWWVLALILFVTLLLCVSWGYRRLQLKRYQRSVLTLFEILANSDLAIADPSRFAAEVSALLRRVTLTRFPRSQVAALEGTAWLTFLDQTGGGGQFSSGPGQVLAEGPYMPRAELDEKALLALAKDWVRRNS